MQKKTLKTISENFKSKKLIVQLIPETEVDKKQLSTEEGIANYFGYVYPGIQNSYFICPF
jgi:hypothetical protein